MSNAKGIDSEARTARHHPNIPHSVPYMKGNVPCGCGGALQPISSEEMSRTKRVIIKALKDHGDDFWNNKQEGESNLYLLDEIIDHVKKLGYDIVVVKRKKGCVPHLLRHLKGG